MEPIMVESVKLYTTRIMMGAYRKITTIQSHANCINLFIGYTLAFLCSSGAVKRLETKVTTRIITSRIMEITEPLCQS